MNELITEKEAIIWASGSFSRPFASNYTIWGDEKLNEFLEENACELVEHADAEYIWEHIISLATSFQVTVNNKLKGNNNG